MAHGNTLFCFGIGYSAGVLARQLLADGWRVAGTARTEEQADRLRGAGIAALPFERGRPCPPARWRG